MGFERFSTFILLSPARVLYQFYHVPVLPSPAGRERRQIWKRANF